MHTYIKFVLGKMEGKLIGMFSGQSLRNGQGFLSSCIEKER